MSRYPQCIMATVCVPWDENGAFDHATFRRSVRATAQSTPHVYVFGTAGEGYAVTDGQFDQIVEVFTEVMRGQDLEPMVGVIHLSLGTILERIERCREMGVRRFQISLPSWGALNDRELFEFFDRVCGRFDDCQFMHYNLPRAKRLVTGVEYGRLAERHENLVATKNTGDSLAHIRSLIDEAPQLRHFLSESGYVYGSLFGECSILASLVMNWPRLYELLEAGRQGDSRRMVEIQREVNVVLSTLWETIGRGRIDGAYDKLFARMLDPVFPLRMLPPYEGASQDEFGQFVNLLRERLPTWFA